ncbi:MAG: hypothetical protein ACK6D3_14170 [Planctomycetaceae bacterium]
MGDTGRFGFKFTSGAKTYYGWVEIAFDPANNDTIGHGNHFTTLYEDATGAAIKVGDTGAAVPEPSTCALAAGGVAAYRARPTVVAS